MSIRTGFYTMVEMICALALAALLTSAAAQSLRALDGSQRLAVAQTRAVLVLQNTVERLRGEKPLTPDRARRVFDEECRFGGLDGMAVGTVDGGRDVLTLRIDTVSRRPHRLAAVTIRGGER